MMRVGIFSDSHGDRRALDELLEKMGHIDAACFLGDIASDAAYLREKLAELRSVTACPHCGKPCGRDDAFCSACGKEL